MDRRVQQMDHALMKDDRRRMRAHAKVAKDNRKTSWSIVVAA